MTPFPRQPAPAFWLEKERAWLAKRPPVTASDALHGWKHEGRLLAVCFHEEVRPPREPRLCAYCDGELGATSPPTIDHFVPLAVDPTLGLRWSNLFPTCTTCNTTYKRDAWVPAMVRPDEDWVVGWFVVNWKGEVAPGGGLDKATRERVQKTIDVLGLNTKARCIARRSVLQRAQELLQAIEEGRAPRPLAALKRLMKLLRGGPYRFAVRQVVPLVAG